MTSFLRSAILGTLLQVLSACSLCGTSSRMESCEEYQVRMAASLRVGEIVVLEQWFHGVEHFDLAQYVQAVPSRPELEAWPGAMLVELPLPLPNVEAIADSSLLLSGVSPSGDKSLILSEERLRGVIYVKGDSRYSLPNFSDNVRMVSSKLGVFCLGRAQ